MIPRRYQPPSGSFGRWYDSILVGMMCDLENIWKFIKSSGATKWWGTEQTTQLPSSSRELYLEALLERKFKPSICHQVMGLDATIFAFWMLSFKPAFSLPSFTFMKIFISSSKYSSSKYHSSVHQNIQLIKISVHQFIKIFSSPEYQNIKWIKY